MSQLDHFFNIYNIILLIPLLFQDAYSISPCSYYEITNSIRNILYNPLSPSSHTFYSTIQLNNSQSISPGLNIDSFNIYFDNSNSISRLPLINNDVLTISRIVSITSPIELSVKRLSSYRWEVLVNKLSFLSSGKYTCSIGGCNASEPISIEYIPVILVPVLNLEIPANTKDLKIKCPIEKSLYRLRICNEIQQTVFHPMDCVSNIPMVTSNTLDSELYFSPPFSTDKIVENSTETMRCLIILWSGLYFFSSQYIISANQGNIIGSLETRSIGESIILSHYCNEFRQSIARHFTDFELFFSKNEQFIDPNLHDLKASHTGLYTCTIHHDYFRVSMTVLNLTIISPPSTNSNINSTFQISRTTPTPNIPLCFIFSFPSCHYFLTIPISGSILLIACLLVCCCITCCCCKIICCSDRSQKFEVHEISSPLVQLEDKKHSFTPLKDHTPSEVPQFSYQRMHVETPFNGDFTESVLKEVPIFRPHKDQTLLTEMPRYQIPIRTSVLHREASQSMPDIDSAYPTDSLDTYTPRHRSLSTHYNISSTHPPSQSVSIDNIVTNPQHQTIRPFLPPTYLAPPPIVSHYQLRTSAGSDLQHSYGILPSPPTPTSFIENPIFSPPPVPPRPPRLAYKPRSDTPSYTPAQTIPTAQPDSFIQTSKKSPLLIHSPQRYVNNYSPQVDHVVSMDEPHFPVQMSDQPILETSSTIYVPSQLPTFDTFHDRNPSIPTPENIRRHTYLTPILDSPPPSMHPTPTHAKGTTININIINHEQRDQLPPDHFVDFL